MTQLNLKKIWLIGLMTLTILMIAVGGVTRLTRSGLSITEWKPVSGIIPPLTKADWVKEFEKYKQSPEYLKVNTHFEIEDYKKIFFWEFVHRLLGRIIFFYALIFGIILVRKSLITRKLLIGICSLIMFQGLMGWVMVKSGLNNEPHVSPYLLATHFFLALSLLAIAFNQLCKVRTAIQIPQNSINQKLFSVVGILISIQLLYGCLTSGFRAGHISDTFPLMNGSFFPQGSFASQGILLAFLDNPFVIQWTHRWIGIATLILIYVFGFLNLSKLSKTDKKPVIHLMGITTSQVIIGISVILLHVPISLASIHQVVATLLVLAYLNIKYRWKTA